MKYILTTTNTIYKLRVSEKETKNYNYDDLKNRIKSKMKDPREMIWELFKKMKKKQRERKCWIEIEFEVKKKYTHHKDMSTEYKDYSVLTL